MLITVDRVLCAWGELVRGREPWRSMPPDDRRGELRRVLQEILDSGGVSTAAARERRIRTVATAHGSFRRAQRCTEGTLANDFVLLRRAMFRAFCACGVTRVAALELVATLRTDFRVARRAARMAHTQMYGRLGDE